MFMSVGVGAVCLRTVALCVREIGQKLAETRECFRKKSCQHFGENCGKRLQAFVAGTETLRLLVYKCLHPTN